MRYLVDMRLTSSARPRTPQEGVAFVQQLIFPTLEMCKKLEADGTIVAGGPASAAIQLILIVEAGSALELDTIVERLPIWPLMETKVTPMTTWDGRKQALQARQGH